MTPSPGDHGQAGAPGPGPRPPTGLRAMVVDDEQSLADLVASYLRRDGFEVTVTGDGAEAVTLARSVDPDVIVLDLGLPGMDGVADKGVDLTARDLVDAEVTVDIDRMGQVMGNLLDNALRHTPAGGSVTVSTGLRETGLVSITVTDTGEGVAAHHLDHVFDRFYRVDTARGRHGGGSGIGLAITRALVEAHGGRVSAASDGPGHGARFSVTIPTSSRG